MAFAVSTERLRSKELHDLIVRIGSDAYASGGVIDFRLYKDMRGSLLLGLKEVWSFRFSLSYRYDGVGLSVDLSAETEDEVCRQATLLLAAYVKGE